MSLVTKAKWFRANVLRALMWAREDTPCPWVAGEATRAMTNVRMPPLTKLREPRAFTTGQRERDGMSPKEARLGF